MEPWLGLANRQDHYLVHIFAAALGVRVKVAHGVQLVTEKLRTEGTVGGRGVDIQNAAAKSKLTGSLHHAAAAVARAGKLLQQIVHLVFLSYGKSERCFGQDCPGHGTLAHGLPAHDLQLGGAGGKIKELPQPLLLPAPGHHGGVVQGQFPAGQYGSGFSQEGFQLLLHPFGGHVILADDHHGPVCFPAQGCDQMAAVDLADAGDRGAGACGDALAKQFVFWYGFQHGQQFIHVFSSTR